RPTTSRTWSGGHRCAGRLATGRPRRTRSCPWSTGGDRAKVGTMSDASATTASTGTGIGAAIATAVSWSIHHSVWWAFLHGLCGWLYVIAYALGWAEQWAP